jgi:epoxyqueuosine reductase
MKQYTAMKNAFQKKGWVVRVTSVVHIRELKEEIASRMGSFDKGVYRDHMSHLRYDYKETLPDAASVIVIAPPHLPTLLHFQYRGKSHHIPIPPTYVNIGVRRAVNNTLQKVLPPYRFAPAGLPEKLLAARTGLGTYGKNTIIYVEGMGSFHQIFAYYSDMPVEKDDWQEKEAMPACASCGRCVRACPAGCIDPDRFFVHVERCITHFNETDGEFPGWLNGEWHNALVGCMRCQIVCPQNREFIGKIDEEMCFTEEETGVILENMPLDLLPPSLKRKIADLDLTGYYGVLSRNLAVLIT